MGRWGVALKLLKTAGQRIFLYLVTFPQYFWKSEDGIQNFRFVNLVTTSFNYRSLVAIQSLSTASDFQLIFQSKLHHFFIDPNSQKKKHNILTNLKREFEISPTRLNKHIPENLKK